MPKTGDSPNRGPVHTVEQVIEAATNGRTKAGAARLLGVSRVTMISYAKRWASVQRTFDEAHPEMVEMAELGLWSSILSRESWAIQFTLRTLGRKDYSERTEHTGAGGKDLIPNPATVLDLTVLSDEELADLERIVGKASAAD